MVPVAESVGVMLGIAADHGDEGEGEDDEDQQNLAARKPELGFAISFDCEDIEETKMKCQLFASRS